MNTPEFNAWLTSVGSALAFIVIFSLLEQLRFSTLDLLIVLVVAGIVTIPTLALCGHLLLGNGPIAV